MILPAIDMHDPATLTPTVTPAPPPGILVADHFVQPVGYATLRPHGTRDWLITYTLGGAGRYRLAAQEFTCVRGDVALLAPGAPHDYATTADVDAWDFFWAHFTPRAHWMRWLRLPEAAPGLYIQPVREATRQARIEQAFQRLLSDSQGIGVWQEELTANALEEILIVVMQQSLKNEGRPLDPRVEHALAYIHQHFRSPVSVAELAAQVALSPSRLAHLFKAETGEAIVQMTLRLRLRQAARLLEFTTLPVGEVAREVGFQSPFAFSRQFRAYFGRSPQVYRRQAAAAEHMNTSLEI